VRQGSVWALVETGLGFPSSGGRCSFRPRLRQRPRRGRTQGMRVRFTPLDGTLPPPVDNAAISADRYPRSIATRTVIGGAPADAQFNGPSSAL
jgi:hypothetical protein